MKLPKVSNLRTGKTCKMTRIYGKTCNMDLYNKHHCIDTVKPIVKGNSMDRHICLKCDKSGYDYCTFCDYCSYCSYLDFINTKKHVYVSEKKTIRIDKMSYSDYVKLQNELIVDLDLPNGPAINTKFSLSCNPKSEVLYGKNWCYDCSSYDCIRTSRYGMYKKRGIALCKSSSKERRRIFSEDCMV
jgi:hypothetical protein